METRKPIKRSAAIVAFSKDHHFALLLIWKIKEGIKKGIDTIRISRYIIHFYEMDLVEHFQDEEELLFKKLPDENPGKIKALTDHKEIKRLIDEMKTKLADKNLVVKFSDTLDAHVRFEERELFNYLQENIFEKDLADLVALDKTRNHEAGEVWEDKFWEKNVV